MKAVKIISTPFKVIALLYLSSCRQNGGLGRKSLLSDITVRGKICAIQRKICAIQLWVKGEVAIFRSSGFLFAFLVLLDDVSVGERKSGDFLTGWVYPLELA